MKKSKRTTKNRQRGKIRVSDRPWNKFTKEDIFLALVIVTSIYKNRPEEDITDILHLLATDNELLESMADGAEQILILLARCHDLA